MGIRMKEDVTRELQENKLNQLHKCLLSILKDFIYVCGYDIDITSSSLV